LAWLALLLIAVALLAMIIIPVYLIMPFKSQTPRALDVAFHLKRWSPLATLVGLVVTVGLSFYLWRSGRWFKRPLLVLLVALAGLLTWFARQNHFEWMFNPLPTATFASVSDTAFVADDDQVMTVAINNEAVAFPVRTMAYHHVVEDTVGGVPIVATY
jgi:phosphoglycerol transferase MdoB-like AlkP superfamily enzyme